MQLSLKPILVYQNLPLNDKITLLYEEITSIKLTISTKIPGNFLPFNETSMEQGSHGISGNYRRSSPWLDEELENTLPPIHRIFVQKLQVSMMGIRI